MLYAILCYANEETVFAWSKDEEEAVMSKLITVQEPYARAGKGKDEALVIDGPFAETKEALLGFYTIDCDNLEEAVAFCKQLSAVNPGSSSYEIRPFYVFRPGDLAT